MFALLKTTPGLTISRISDGKTAIFLTELPHHVDALTEPEIEDDDGGRGPTYTKFAVLKMDKEGLTELVERITQVDGVAGVEARVERCALPGPGTEASKGMMR